MEQKKRSPQKRSVLQWLRSLRLSHKIMASMGLLIFCSNLLIMLLVSRAATSSLIQKNYEQLQGQLTIALSTVTNSIDDVAELMVSITTTSDLANYVAEGSAGQAYSLETVNGTNEALRLLKRASNMVDYVAVIRMDSEEFLYVGTELKSDSLYQSLLDNYRERKMLFHSGISQNLLFDAFDVPELNLFCPIYAKYDLSGAEPEAVLVVGLNTESMMDYLSAGDEQLSVRILNGEGQVLVSNDLTEIGTVAECFADYQGSSGQLSRGDDLIAYQQLSDANNVVWVADGAISKTVLFSSMYRTERIICVVILLCTAMAIAAGIWLCRWFYGPIGALVQAMTRVSDGDLDTQMPLYEGQDLRQVSEIFNSMTISLKKLIASVQRREQENTEIRLNALQSQIKPHFLYNTLECIHWQALLEGAPESSKMVMALSRYYRLCLSKGADVVPLSQEIEHTMSYVTIQNMRFDNILTVEDQIPPELLDLPIPKITLQPLVENAIYHGIKPVENRKGRVILSGQTTEDGVLLTVADDGIGMTQAAMDHLNETIDVLCNDGSYGIKNVHQRLEIRYGKGYGLHYSGNVYGGVTVTIRIPGKPVPTKEE